MTADDVDERSTIEDLRSLATDYGLTVDARDGERFAELFVPDGELVVPKYPDDLRPVITRTGYDALRRIPEGLRRYDRTFHQMSNHRYSVDGAQATGTVQCVAHHVSFAAEPVAADRGTDVIWFIRYHDAYRRSEGEWKFARRELRLQWVEEHAISLPGAPTPS